MEGSCKHSEEGPKVPRLDSAVGRSLLQRTGEVTALEAQPGGRGCVSAGGGDRRGAGGQPAVGSAPSLDTRAWILGVKDRVI